MFTAPPYAASMSESASILTSAVPSPARVAVIVPAYGVAHLLGEALASVQAQTFADWQCIVIDDGGPDDVAGAVAPFLADPRFIFLATTNQGVSAARNQAIGASTATLIALLDGDDLFRPAYLAAMVPILEGNPAIRLATCNARIFGAVAKERFCFEDKQGSSDGQHGSLADVLDRSFGVYIGSTFRRADFDVVGGYDTSMAQSEDLDLWVRLMQLGGKARYVDRVLGDYRVRAGSASANAGRMLMGNIKVYEKARASLPSGQAEHAVVDRMIAESRAALHLEHAIDLIIDGETTRGLAGLKQARERFTGPVWIAAFALWRLFPALARPMLLWRRHAHGRGEQGGILALIGEARG